MMRPGSEPTTADGATDGSPALSRRNALKAGVGLGVGAIAWTGPTITSVGATPSYAAGCTFAVERIIEDVRNTDQRTDCGAAALAYHEVATLQNLPPGYVNDPSGWNAGVCSTVDDPYDMTLTYPIGLHCAIQVEFWKQSDPSNVFTVTFDDIIEDEESGITTLSWHLPTMSEVTAAAEAEGINTAPANWLANAFYRMVLRCVTPGLEYCFV